MEKLASGRAIGPRARRPAYDVVSDDIIWEQVTHALTGLVENLFLTESPERTVPGGSVMMRQPQLLTMVRQMLSERLGGYGFARQTADNLGEFLVTPVLGDDAGPTGAVAVGLEALQDQPPS